MYSYGLALFFSNKYLLVTAAEGMIGLELQQLFCSSASFWEALLQ